MLAHLDLVADAPHPYLGLRALGHWRGRPPTASPTHKHSFAEIAQAVDRSERTVQAWALHSGTGGHIMPQYVSAYMALLDHAHPTLVLVTNGTGAGESDEGSGVVRFPAVPRATWDNVHDLLMHHGLSHKEVAQAFNFDEGNKQYSVRTLGNDGVRWMLLRLMTDHLAPFTYVRPRQPGETMTPWTMGTTVVSRRAAQKPPPAEPVHEWPVTAGFLREWVARQAYEYPHMVACVSAPVAHPEAAPARPAAYGRWPYRQQKDWERLVYLRREHPALLQQAARLAERIQRAHMTFEAEAEATEKETTTPE